MLVCIAARTAATSFSLVVESNAQPSAICAKNRMYVFVRRAHDTSRTNVADRSFANTSALAPAARITNASMPARRFVDKSVPMHRVRRNALSRVRRVKSRVLGEFEVEQNDDSSDLEDSYLSFLFVGSVHITAAKSHVAR